MTTNGLLAGKLIAVTRPVHQAETLCRAIEEAGGEALRFPLLEIVPIADSAAFAPIAARLSSFDFAFFVSPNAVEHGLAGLRHFRAWPPNLRVAAVGQGSARALKANGFDNVLVPTEGFDSEAVLALPEFAPDAIRGHAVLIMRGESGRELLGETLMARGAHVEYLACYQRRCPDTDPSPLLKRAAHGELDALSITSSEASDYLVKIVGEKGLGCLLPIPVFVPHPRVAEHCRRHGFKQIVTVPSGDDVLLQAFVAFFG
ncbi:MAG: uroporphyrinogen-III synthase [Azoarcus sp.]|jgi:uroporphyrinogen-III synthase|nr:uroporphyrinogen-III synthase [Azoarcus sp.]